MGNATKHTVTMEVEVDGPVYKSAGPAIYLERQPAHGMGEPTMDRLTPEQAVELGEWLIEAGGGA